MPNPAADLLARYARRHRDPRNIASHGVAVPLMLCGLGTLLAHPALPVAGWIVSPAFALALVLSAWYLSRGSLFLGVVTSAAATALMLAGQQMADGSVGRWLGCGLGALICGRLLQVTGHCYEGRHDRRGDVKPPPGGELEAFAVAPMFLVAELLFSAGWNRPLQAEIERRAGPVRLRDLARIA